MERFGSTKNVITISPSLSNRRGKRPLTIRGPLHLQCGDHGDDRALRHLVEDVIAWPDIEASPLPVGRADLVSLRVAKDVATGDASVFITGREFGRVLFGAPTRSLTISPCARGERTPLNGMRPGFAARLTAIARAGCGGGVETEYRISKGYERIAWPAGAWQGLCVRSQKTNRNGPG